MILWLSTDERTTVARPPASLLKVGCFAFLESARPPIWLMAVETTNPPMVARMPPAMTALAANPPTMAMTGTAAGTLDPPSLLAVPGGNHRNAGLRQERAVDAVADTEAALGVQDDVATASE